MKIHVWKLRHNVTEDGVFWYGPYFVGEVVFSCLCCINVFWYASSIKHRSWIAIRSLQSFVYLNLSASFGNQEFNYCSSFKLRLMFSYFENFGAVESCRNDTEPIWRVLSSKPL